MPPLLSVDLNVITEEENDVGHVIKGIKMLSSNKNLANFCEKWLKIALIQT